MQEQIVRSKLAGLENVGLKMMDLLGLKFDGLENAELQID